MGGLRDTLGKAINPLAGVGAELRKGPSVLLTEWADGHGLEYLDRELAPGFSVVADEDDNRFNICHGILPGGALGALAHVKERIDRQTSIGHVGPLSIGTHREAFTQPYTLVGVSAPAAGAALYRFIFDRHTPDNEYASLAEADLSAAQLPGWRLWHAPQAEQQVLVRLAQGSLAEWLRVAPAEATAMLRYGVLVFAHPGYLEGAELDPLCEQACAITKELDEASAALFAPQRFSEPVPAWSGPPIEPVSAGIAGAAMPGFQKWMQLPNELAERFGNLENEDTLSFIRAYPWFGVPGLPMTVMRGTLPETQIQGRIVILNDVDPTFGSRGYDCVAFEAPGAAACEFEYDLTHDVRYTIREGVLAAYRKRDLNAKLSDLLVVLSRDAQGLAQKLGVAAI
ncbi:MAG: hypothetical protein ACR2G3_00370 [Solirubrobacterales bacterium]